MAHINYTRSAQYMRRRSIGEILPPENWGASFAAFCGDPYQRRMAGLQAVRRCCGRMGVVVLQNDPLLAAALGRLREDMPELARQNPGFRTYSVNPFGSPQRYYDPLYGLNATGVLDAIMPIDGRGYGTSSALNLRSWLQAYLDIMQLQFGRSPAPFGRYPFNLDLLLQLAEMPPDRLQRQVLQYLPSPGRESISTLLAQDDASKEVYAAVRSFANEMEEFLWTPRSFAAHPCISIVEAVRQRCIISVTVPTARPTVLRYLYQELKALQDARVPFLLLAAEVPLTASSELRSLFTGPHETASYSTGILAGDLSYVIAETDELSPLLAEHQEVLLFRCTSTQQARPFSEALGTYQRLVREEHQDRHWQPFRIFPVRARGVGIREVTEHNINAQELVQLQDGAVLCGGLYDTPILIGQVLP